MIVFSATELPDFKKVFDVTSLFLEHDGQILLLCRQDHKPQGNHWGVPAGKIDPGETPAGALLRELREETGIHLTENDLTDLGRYFVRYPDYDFVYYMYRTVLTGNRPVVVLDPSAHKDFVWIEPSKASSLLLMPGLDECIDVAYKV